MFSLEKDTVPMFLRKIPVAWARILVLTLFQVDDLGYIIVTLFYLFELLFIP